MGICKCRKRTDCFCFVHKKNVCPTCILEHPDCVVKSYLDWLQDSDYDLPACSVCKEGVVESNSLRLTCLHLFHPECLDARCSGLPRNTACAGFSCPDCGVAIRPAPTDRSLLAETVRSYLESSSWAAGAGLTERAPTPEILNQPAASAPSSSSYTRVSQRQADNTAITIDGNDDDDKYNKRPTQHHSNSILIDSPVKARSSSSSSSSSVSVKHVLALFAIASTLATVIVLYHSLSQEEQLAAE
eukprot:TRINITY_DN160_c2_g4_i1.p1 TRINITY_DN160_c2_g4~~TRINITY_DN160_c2_g4_i1.p1  ORF type:complete len:244 (-),score=47.84 TRINITY_DN160_c2_g4_i1:25-756(-)